MSEEILYQVTADDLVIGPVSRSDAHNDRHLIHREIAIILKDQHGRVLLAQRSWEKKVLPGKWDVTCAGHVPWGMETEAAAHMELSEELGFDTELQYVGRQLALYDWETHLTHLFIGQYQGQELSLQPSEVADAGLLDEQQVTELGAAVNLEFRDFIYGALNDQFSGEHPELWDQEQDLRS